MGKSSSQGEMQQLKRACDDGNYSIVCTEGGKLLEKALKEIFLASLRAPYKERVELEELEMEIAGKQIGVDKFTLGDLVNLFKRANLLSQWTKKHAVENAVFKSVDLSFFVNTRNKAAHDNDDTVNRHDAQLFITYLEALYCALGEVAIRDTHSPACLLAPYRQTDTGSAFRDVFDLAGPLRELVSQEYERLGHVKINNISLDMGISWDMLQSQISNPRLSQLEFRGLLIDPEAVADTVVAIPEEWRRTVELSIGKINRFRQTNEAALREKKISVQVRKNPMLPLIHGICINDSHLFWAFCRIDATGCLTGGYDPYMYCTADNDMGRYYLDVFNSWFNCWWNNGRNI